jgi:hypothetical protein
MNKSVSLQAAMDRHGLADEDLLDEMLGMVPAASAVIVTGSLAAGFGNPHSDIDLVCIAAGGQYSGMPVMVYKGEAKIDCEYWLLPGLADAAARIEQADMLRCAGDFHAWKQLTHTLQPLVKLAISCVLHADDAARTLLEHVRSPAFSDSVRRWWELEALRLLMAARRLLPLVPQVAGNLYSEAVFAVLSARAASQSLLFGKKWLGEKLLRLGEESALALYRLALMLPGGTDAEVRERCILLDRAVATLPAIEPMLSRVADVRWWLNPGARLNRFADCMLLWQGRAGYQFPRHHAAESWQPGQAIGTLRGADDGEPLVAALFTDGLTWPGLETSAAEARSQT